MVPKTPAGRGAASSKPKATTAAPKVTPVTKESRETAIPKREEALARLVKAFEKSSDTKLYHDTREWVKDFYRQREKKSSHTCLSSDPFFRKVTTALDKVVKAFTSGHPWEEYLPSRATIIGTTFLHQPGSCSGNIVGALITIQRLDLISIPEIIYTSRTQNTANLNVAIDDRVANLQTDIQGINDSVTVAQNNASEAKSAAEAAQSSIGDVVKTNSQVVGNLRKKGEKIKAHASKLDDIEKRLKAR
ncbi:hypothetical protein EsH8_V_001097 [Colletotrichum jinshuiense]